MHGFTVDDSPRCEQRERIKSRPRSHLQPRRTGTDFTHMKTVLLVLLLGLAPAFAAPPEPQAPHIVIVTSKLGAGLVRHIMESHPKASTSSVGLSLLGFAFFGVRSVHDPRAVPLAPPQARPAR
jgi:hypothetical protein